MSCDLLFADNLHQFVAWRLIGGGIGTASVISPNNTAEIAPTRIRGRCVTLYLGHRCRNSDSVPRSHVDCVSREQTARQDSNEFSKLTHCSQASAHELNVRC